MLTGLRYPRSRRGRRGKAGSKDKGLATKVTGTCCVREYVRVNAGDRL